MQLSEAPADAIKHVFSHRVWHIVTWPARARRAPKLERLDGTFAWVDHHGAPEGGVPTLTRKLLRVLGEA
jgi:A/G-specific adenine glycosylase